MKPTVLLLFLYCLAASKAPGQALDWRAGPVSHTGGGVGVVLINAANDLADWTTLNPAGNGIALADPGASGTYYFGFDWMVTNNAGETGGGGFFGGLWFYDGGTERGGAGNSWTTLNLEMAGPGFSASSTPAVPYVIGTPARLVLKIKFNANADDNLTLWLNPIAGGWGKRPDRRADRHRHAQHGVRQHQLAHRQRHWGLHPPAADDCHRF